MNSNYGLFGNASKEDIRFASILSLLDRLKLDFGGYLTREEVLETLEREFQKISTKEAVDFLDKRSTACEFIRSRYIKKLVDLIYQYF